MKNLNLKFQGQVRQVQAQIKGFLFFRLLIKSLKFFCILSTQIVVSVHSRTTEIEKAIHINNISLP